MFGLQVGNKDEIDNNKSQITIETIDKTSRNNIYPVPETDSKQNVAAKIKGPSLTFLIYLAN